MEFLISDVEKEDEKALNRHAETIPKEHREEFLAYNRTPWDDIAGSPFRTSFPILAFSVVEHQLKLFCRDTGILARTPIGIGELRGSMLEKVRVFVHRLVGFQRPLQPMWAQLGNMYEVRNAIVHHGGSIEESRRAVQLKQYLKHARGIEVRSGFIEVQQEFCEDLLATINKFFDELHVEQRALCERVATYESKQAM